MLAWMLLGGRGPAGRSAGRDADVDRAELEAAERDVRDAANEDEVRDWGPGAGQPRPPERL